jgi:multidrug efflux pump subunit AcrA (membrane-fusion protein)
MTMAAFYISAAMLAAAPGGNAPSIIKLDGCVVSLIEEADVPAKEHGELMKIPVVEGQAVKTGELLAQIDDLDAIAKRDVAQFKLEEATEEAHSKVNVDFSKASADVAQADYEAAVEANKRLTKTYSDSDLRKFWLEWKKSVLGIEKAEMDLRICGLKAKVSEAELKVEKENVARRQILSPLDGAVEQIRRHAGEWVQPGDPVLHVVRLDRLLVQGFVKAADVATLDIADRPVEVTVKLARGRQETFKSKISYVSSMVLSGVYRISAEVQNRQENGRWLLQSGLNAEMAIAVR